MHSGLEQAALLDKSHDLVQARLCLEVGHHEGLEALRCLAHALGVGAHHIQVGAHVGARSVC